LATISHTIRTLEEGLRDLVETTRASDTRLKAAIG